MRRLCELEEVATGADHGPFGANALEATKKELPEASRLLDLTKHPFDNLFAQAVATAPSGALERRGHGAHQRGLRQFAMSGGMGLPVPGAPWREKASDAPLLQGGQVGLCREAGVTRDFPWLAAEMGRHVVHERQERAIVG